MRKPSFAGVLLTLAFLLFVAGCNGDDSNDSAGDAGDASSEPESTQTTPPPPPPPPKPGRCYNLGKSGLSNASSDADPVSCKKTHTAQTYLVAKLRKSLTDAQPLDVKAITETVSERCDQAFAEHIGGDDETRTLARVHPVWFAPTEEEMGLGARWFRCDVTADKQGGAPAQLPGTTKGMLDADDALSRWGTCAPGDSSSPESDATLCSQPHGLRAISAVNVGDADSSWPGPDALAEDGRCEPAVRDFVDDSTGALSYQWTRPTKQQWKDGRRYGLCWSDDGS